MASDKIVIKGARVNNLKNIDLTIPRDKLIVFTGLSGDQFVPDILTSQAAKPGLYGALASACGRGGIGRRTTLRW